MEEKTLKQLLEVVAKSVIDATPEEFEIEEVAERLKATFYSSVPSLTRELPKVQVLREHEASKQLKRHGFKVIQDYVETVYNTDHLVIQFYGTEFCAIRAYELLSLLGYTMFSARRVFDKEDVHKDNDDIDGEIIGENWVEPVNEVVICLSC